MTCLRHLSLLSLFIFSALVLAGQEEPAQEHQGDTLVTDADLFEQEWPLDMTLRFNLKEYQRKKDDENYMDVELSIRLDDSTEIKKDVRIKARGNFRKGYCSFAPFWLNIRKSGVKNPHLQGVKRLKIVTHCSGAKSSQPYLMKEYLVYRMYALISPASFRTRLIRIRYIDSGRKERETEGYAFMIEAESMLAERLGGTVIKNDRLGMVHTRREDMMRMANFQYMVANSDYSVAGRHNVKLLGLGHFGKEGYTPVPYDFDYSGFVDAHYAVPGENLGISTVRDRYYLGPCGEPEDYRAAIDELMDRKQEILDLVREFAYLTEGEKKKALRYLESYFSNAAQAGFLEREYSRTCR